MCGWQVDQGLLVLTAQRWSHLTEVVIGERRDRDAGEELPTAPGHEALSRQQGEARRAGEGAAALCGDGETHQVCDRSRTDCRSPELANVRMMRGESRCCRFPDDGSYVGSSCDRWASNIEGTNGDARRWREVPGIGGRTSTASRNSSGRHRD